MKHTRLVMSALCALTLMFGCGLSDTSEPRSPSQEPVASEEPVPQPEPEPEPTDSVRPDPTITVKKPWKAGMFQKGIQIYWHSTGDTADTLMRSNALLDYVVSLGANSVGITFSIYTDGASPTTVYAGKESPTLKQLRIFLQAAKARKLRVLVRPTINEVNIVESRDGAWRGSIEPQDVGRWFDAYRKTITSYVPVAIEHGVDEFVAGAELNSMEPYDREWIKLIREIRTHGFEGMISYAFNWDTSPSLPFESLAIDAYPSISLPDSATVPRLTKALLAWYNQRPAHFLRKLVAQEAGIPAQDNAYPRPWDWGTGDVPLNLKVQENWFTAMCQATKAAGLRGLYYWSVDSEADLGNPNAKTDPRGSFIGRPAEQAIKRCFN